MFFKIKKIISVALFPLLISVNLYGGDPVDPNKNIWKQNVIGATIKWLIPHKGFQIGDTIEVVAISETYPTNAILADGQLIHIYWLNINYEIIEDGPLILNYQFDQFFGIEKRLSYFLPIGSIEDIPLRFLFYVRASSIHDGRNQISNDPKRLGTITLDINEFSLVDHSIQIGSFSLQNNTYRLSHVKLQSFQEIGRRPNTTSFGFLTGFVPSTITYTDFSSGDYYGFGQRSIYSTAETFLDQWLKRQFKAIYQITFLKSAWHGEKSEISKTFDVNFQILTQY